MRDVAVCSRGERGRLLFANLRKSVDSLQNVFLIFWELQYSVPDGASADGWKYIYIVYKKPIEYRISISYMVLYIIYHAQRYPARAPTLCNPTLFLFLKFLCFSLCLRVSEHRCQVSAAVRSRVASSHSASAFPIGRSVPTRASHVAWYSLLWSCVSVSSVWSLKLGVSTRESTMSLRSLCLRSRACMWIPSPRLPSHGRTTRDRRRPRLKTHRWHPAHSPYPRLNDSS